MKYAFTAEQIRLIEEFSAQDMTQRAIAQAIGTSRDIVADEMRRRGISKKVVVLPSPQKPGKPKPLAWTEERKARFRKLFEAGRTHQQIATALGITRNASVGLARRLGFDNRRTAASPPADAVARAEVERADEARRMQRRQAECRRRVERRAGKTTKEASAFQEGFAAAIEAERTQHTIAPIPSLPDVDSVGVSIWDLKHHHCRWPLDGESDANMRYCGKPKREPWEGNSYCAEHRVRSLGPQRSAIRPPPPGFENCAR